MRPRAGRSMNGSAAEFVPRRPSSASSSFTPNAAALPFMMPGHLFGDHRCQLLAAKHDSQAAIR